MAIVWGTHVPYLFLLSTDEPWVRLFDTFPSTKNQTEFSLDKTADKILRYRGEYDPSIPNVSIAQFTLDAMASYADDVACVKSSFKFYIQAKQLDNILNLTGECRYEAVVYLRRVH